MTIQTFVVGTCDRCSATHSRGEKEDVGRVFPIEPVSIENKTDLMQFPFLRLDLCVSCREILFARINALCAEFKP